MRIRILFVAAAMVAIGAGAVIAQSDPIAERKALMKENDAGAGVLVAMMRGTAPYDASKVDPIFTQWAETAKKLPGLFPDSSKTGDTRASPKIWETKADFDAKAAEFAKVVADNRDKAKKSLDDLKAAVGAVGRVCADCHGDYRLSRR